MLTKKQIKFLNNVCLEKWAEHNNIVDINDDIYISINNLHEFPVQFGQVNGKFFCRYNKLTTLKGAPSTIDGYFD